MHYKDGKIETCGYDVGLKLDGAKLHIFVAEDVWINNARVVPFPIEFFYIR